MRKIRSFVVSIVMMLIISMLSLLAVSMLTYLFKWYADKAMVGIIVTYILVGFAGGITLKILNKEKMGLRGKGLEALCLSGIFMLLLFVLSIFVFQNPFEISGRLLMIWLLLTSSTFLGRIL